MKRTALSGFFRTSAAVGLAATVAACGTAGSSRTVTRSRPAARAATLTVNPSMGAPTTVFELHFTAPASAVVTGGQRQGFQLGLSGPQKSSCLGSRSVAVPSVAQGVRVSVPLDPAKLGGRWCAGTYSARLLEVQTPVCSPGMMCPQFVRVVGTIGRVSFRVVSAA
jgi:hypothetical protein